MQKFVELKMVLMKTEQIYFYGYQGDIIRLLDFPDASMKGPIIEIDNNYLLQNGPVGQVIFSSSYELHYEELKSKIGDTYRQWERFGYMGDVVCLRLVHYDSSWIYTIAFIGRLEKNKPGLAVDLIPIFAIAPGEYYFVGIKRKYNPGKGLPALVGGFIDVNGYHLETPLEAVIREASEEIGLVIKPLDKNAITSKDFNTFAWTLYQSKNVRKDLPSTLILHGSFPTGQNEEMTHLGLKRVYQTTVYSLLVDMKSLNLSQEDLRKWLKAGDDAAELVVMNLKNALKAYFGLGHHKKIFSDAIKELQDRGFKFY